MRASINRATSGAGAALVAARAGHAIVVTSYNLVIGTAVNVKFQGGDGSTQTDFSPAQVFADGSGIVEGFNPNGHFETASGAGLYLNLSGAVQVSGKLTYHYRAVPAALSLNY